MRLRRLLHARGLRYRVQQRARRGDWLIPDLVFPGAKVAVFVDGCFWHGCPIHFRVPKTNADWWAAKITRTKARDMLADEELKASGWLPLRYWAHEDVPTVACTIAATVASRRARRA